MFSKNLAQFTYALTVAVSLSALILSALANAQTVGSTGSSIVITRTPYLSISSVPASFSFPPVATRATSRDIFSNADGVLPEDKTISVTDSRKAGGFILQAQASDFTSNGNIIPASALRVVSTSSFNRQTEKFRNGSENNGVFYAEPFTGPKTLTAPVNASNTNFGQISVFNDARAINDNSLAHPVDLLKGCLPANEGRVGTVSLGLAFALNIPAYTIPGEYHATITYTVVDSTSDNCP